MMGNLIILFLQRLTCDMALRNLHPSTHNPNPNRIPELGGETEFEHNLLPGPDILDYVPRLRMFTPYTSDSSVVVHSLHPTCMSTRTEKTPLIPKFNEGWYVRLFLRCIMSDPLDCRRNWTYTTPWGAKKSYVLADNPGSLIGFPVTIGTIGRVRVTYLRSNAFGLGQIGCWVERNEQDTNGKKMSDLVVIDGFWLESLNIAR